MSNEGESYDFRQGYGQGYTNGFWTGAIASFFGTAVLLYLIGNFAP